MARGLFCSSTPSYRKSCRSYPAHALCDRVKAKCAKYLALAEGAGHSYSPTVFDTMGFLISVYICSYKLLLLKPLRVVSCWSLSVTTSCDLPSHSWLLWCCAAICRAFALAGPWMGLRHRSRPLLLCVLRRLLPLRRLRALLQRRFPLDLRVFELFCVLVCVFSCFDLLVL